MEDEQDTWQDVRQVHQAVPDLVAHFLAARQTEEAKALFKTLQRH